jgi:SecD/SecF fusion protein
VFKITRFRLAVVVFIVLGAIFIDGYSFFYRAFVAHQWFPQKLTSAPSIAGRPIYVHKGLDLQGGTELTIAICKGFNNPPGVGCRNGPPKGHSVADAQAATLPVLEKRVNALGVSESLVQAQGDDQILVQIPGVGLQEAINIVGTTAKLHFATAKAGAPNPNDPTFIADQQRLYEPKQFNNPVFYPSGYHWLIDPKLDASDVTSATVGTDQNTGQIAVQISFNSAGAEEWAKITQAAYNVYTTNPSSPMAQVAIFLDNEVLTAPDVVQGGQSNNTQITGNFTPQSAQTLASQISSGSLPAEIATIASTEVSATLGQSSVQQSLIAGAVGLIVVILFMLGYYRFPGLIATVGLIVYSAVVLAIFKLLPVTLSLAGLAGFILSVGMAVDANVLIFERIRDELRHGRPVPLAVDSGFRRAFPAIRDSNLSTIIACLVLGLLGTSVIKGFAITLGVGVAVSFFTAITVTRAVFAWVLDRRLGRNPTLYTEIHQEYEQRPPRGRFDIVRARNWYFAGSLAIIIPGILAIIIWGFNLGVDFRGGNRIDVQLARSASTAQVTQVVKSVAGDLRPEVQGEANNHFTVTTLPAGVERIDGIDNALNHRFGIAKGAHNQPNVQVQQVGPTIASSLVTNAVILIVVSAALIALYLAFAFRGQRAISPWRFSVCTFLKLLHDVFVLAGIWAIIGHFTDLAQVDSLFVTAVLTSVAFSIHDTIVVFDRVRENLRVGPRLTFDQVVNLSTVQTMTRSLNTSLTVVFVLLALVLFGGDTIRGFVLALLIGIVTGTYSSIFNASTLLVAWEKARSRVAQVTTRRGRVAVRTA